MSSTVETPRKPDYFGFLLYAITATVLGGAGFAALHFGLFGNIWQLLGWLVVCCAFIFFGLPGQTAPQTNVARSRWAERIDVIAKGVAETDSPESKEQHVYLGYLENDEGRGRVALRYPGEKHLIFFGPTGSGKSMSVIVPNAQCLRRSMIIIDPKGDVTAITARRRKAIGDKVIVLNPFGMFTKKRRWMKSAGWNPLLHLKDDKPNFASLAMCIADAIVEELGGAGNSNSAFFDRSAKNFVQALVMWERINNPDAPNLRNVPQLFSEPATYDPETKALTGGFLFTLKRMAVCKNDVIREAANDVLERLEDKNSQSTSVRDTILTLKSHFAFLRDDRIVDDMVGGEAIDFGALHRKITTIYVVLPVGEMREQAKWLRIFVNLALRNLYKSAPTDDKPPTLPPVLFMLDEFGNLGRLEEVVKALNMARSSRVQLIFFLQNMGQLTSPRAYKDELGSFTSGVGATVTFKTGALDLETAEHLAKAIGNQEARVQTEAQGGGSVRPEAIPLKRAEDIARLDPGTTLNIIEPCPWPIRANVPVYVDTHLKEGLDPNPTYFG